MKPVLMDNAFEAWASAIRFCNDIKDGKATLQYQKSFVSTLHNAVELIMKQMLLNNNDHRVAEVRKVKTEADAQLLLNYLKATNLNRFFSTLSTDELSKFHTIQFHELISLHKKLFGSSLKEGETLKTELELLQRLRNDETHFMIRQGSFLSEEDFCTLHNFMIRFDKIMKTWSSSDNDDLDAYIFLYWDWFSATNDNGIYGFDCEPLRGFSYETAVRNSKLAKDIAELLRGDYLYGAPNFSPYDIAKDLVEGYNGLSAQFDEIWAMVYMMQSLGMIVVDEILDDEQGKVCFLMNILL